MGRRLLSLLAGGIVASVVASGATPSGAEPPDSAGRFIVTLTPRADAAGVADEYRRGGGAEIDFVYDAALNGFAGRMSDTAVGRMRGDSRVVRVERDGVVTASALTTQQDATWGLDRVDQRPLPLDATYSYGTDGAGVTAYVLDTGIRRTHVDFGSRVAGGYTAINDGRGTDDCNGHGTHVAGTVGGATWGVAKAVGLVPVRVLDCNGSGTWSGVIAGIDWVTKQTAKPAVANMSLGGGANSSVDDAVKRSLAAGVTYAVAAGNSNADACTASPARVPDALTVAATTSTDARASYSNWGSCVDLFAPGSSITSAWYTSDTSTNRISGTSMASPHVAGAAVRYLQESPGASPATVAAAIRDTASVGLVVDPATSPDLLLHVAASAPVEETPPPDGGTNTAPTAAVTKSCSGTSCTFSGSGSDAEGDLLVPTWSGTNVTSDGWAAWSSYTSTGTYTVTLTATDPGGLTGTATATVSCSWSGKGRKKQLVCA